MSSMLMEAIGFKSAWWDIHHEVLREDAEATVGPVVITATKWMMSNIYFFLVFQA